MMLVDQLFETFNLFYQEEQKESSSVLRTSLLKRLRNLEERFNVKGLPTKVRLSTTLSAPDKVVFLGEHISPSGEKTYYKVIVRPPFLDLSFSVEIKLYDTKGHRKRNGALYVGLFDLFNEMLQES